VISRKTALFKQYSLSGASGFLRLPQSPLPSLWRSDQPPSSSRDPLLKTLADQLTDGLGNIPATYYIYIVRIITPAINRISDYDDLSRRKYYILYYDFRKRNNNIIVRVERYTASSSNRTNPWVLCIVNIMIYYHPTASLDYYHYYLYYFTIYYYYLTKTISSV
jgi:hypothetical protein